jgi:hypothetical protein
MRMNDTEKQLEAKVMEAAHACWRAKTTTAGPREMDAFNHLCETVSALEGHRRPKPLSAEEANAMVGLSASPAIVVALSFVLDEAARRWCAVIDKALAEAGFPDCHPSHPKQARNVVRRALRPGVAP